MNNDSLPIGTLLNSGVREYEILSVLGQGGFGITYLAKAYLLVDNIPIEALFAIKEHYIAKMNERQGMSVVISNENNQQEIDESIDSFITEAKRLNKLSLHHPGIVRVNENFKANDTAYYVMEYIKGHSLREYVRQSSIKRLTEEDSLKLFRPVVETIGFLHKNKVTHLDIKPDNILIRENGQPVVIDFGLSKHYNSKGSPTSSIKALGCSDGYSPMEQYAGITVFTPEADIYALAATLLYMLTGKEPRKSTEIDANIIRNSLPDTISEQTVTGILKSMEKLKENRISKTEELLKLFPFVDNKLDNTNNKDTYNQQQNNSNSTRNKTRKFGSKNANGSLLEKLKKYSFSERQEIKAERPIKDSIDYKNRGTLITVVLYAIQLLCALGFFFMLNELRLWPDELLSDSVWLIMHCGMLQFALLPIVIFICNWMVIKGKRSGFYLLVSLVSLIVYPLVLLGSKAFFLPSTAMSFSALAVYWLLLQIPFSKKSAWALMIPSTSKWVHELFVITIILWFPIALCGSAENPKQTAYTVGIPLFLILIIAHLLFERISNSKENKMVIDNVVEKRKESKGQNDKITLYVTISICCLILISVAALIHFVEMATDSYGISGSENATTWIYVWIWILTTVIVVFRKKIPSVIAFGIHFFNVYKQSKHNHYE